MSAESSQLQNLATPEQIVQALEARQDLKYIVEACQHTAASVATLFIMEGPYTSNLHHCPRTNLTDKILYLLTLPGFCLMEGLKSLSEDLVALLGCSGSSTEDVWLSLQSALAAFISVSFKEVENRIMEKLWAQFPELREEKQLTQNLIEEILRRSRKQTIVFAGLTVLLMIYQFSLNLKPANLPLVQVLWGYTSPLPYLLSMGDLLATCVKRIYQKFYANPKCRRTHLAFVRQLVAEAGYTLPENSLDAGESLVKISLPENDNGTFLRALDRASIIFYGSASKGIVFPISKRHQYSTEDFKKLFLFFKGCLEEERRAAEHITYLWSNRSKNLAKLREELSKIFNSQHVKASPQPLTDVETCYELRLVKYRVEASEEKFEDAADYLSRFFKIDQDPEHYIIDIMLSEREDLEYFNTHHQALNLLMSTSQWLKQHFLPAFSSPYKILEWQISDQQWPIECRANTPYQISPKINSQIKSCLKYRSNKQEIVLSFSQAFATRDAFRALAMPANPMPSIMEPHQFQRVSPEASKEAPNTASGSRDPITAPSPLRYFLNGKELDPHCVTTFRDSSYCAVYISPEIRAHFVGSPYQIAAEVFQGGEDTHFTHDGHGKGACWLKRESRPTITNGLVISMKSHHPASEARIFFTEYFGEYEKRSERHSMRFFTPVAYGTHQEIQKVLPAPLLLT